ncbi:MAG: enoyl-CoA hydratase, partial [Hyphomicrobiales bacterium]|nr:enoyl-CoA hydratase [Hyphomicrobiales bacterium]
MTAKLPIRNKTWAELKVGDSASLERSCTAQDLVLFAHASGNVNPLMLPPADGSAPKERPIAPSMWVGSLVSAVHGNLLPGPGTLYREQQLRFLKRVHVGDKLKVTVTCREKRAAPIAIFDTRIEDERGQTVCEGMAELEAPAASQVIEPHELP